MNTKSYSDKASNRGLGKLINGAYKGGLGVWLGLANVFILAATVIFILCGYKFFVVETAEEQVFWGLCTLGAILIQVALKQWVWLEIARTSIIREVLSLRRLVEKNQAGD